MMSPLLALSIASRSVLFATAQLAESSAPGSPVWLTVQLAAACATDEKTASISNARTKCIMRGMCFPLYAVGEQALPRILHDTDRLTGISQADGFGARDFR